MLTVSIALATHNGEKYLPAQLDSIAKQIRLPVELVVTDDGSTDRTLEIVEAFAARVPFAVRIVRAEKRLGFRDNFMRAARLCSADLVAFCDQDDIWEPEKLARLVPVFDNEDVLLAYHNAVLISDANKRVAHLYPGTSSQKVFPPLSRHPWLVIPGFLQVFRRELVEFMSLHAKSRDLYWPEAALPHDRWFVLLASVLGSIAYVGEPLARYRQHHGNVFGAYFDRRARFDQIFGAERFIRAASVTAANRSETFSQLGGMLNGLRRDRAQQGVVFYDALKRRLDTRTEIYAAASYGARVRALVQLYKEGGYSRAPGTARFSRIDLLMDLYLAATLGPRLRRLLPEERR